MRTLTLLALWALGGWALAGCPKPPPPVIAEALRTVDDGGDLTGADGIRAVVVGTLARRRPTGVATDGTALVLADGTEIYVSEGAPPDGWDWLLGSMVRVQGTLWAHAPTGWPVAKLEAPEAPMPADMTMPILSLEGPPTP